MSSPAISRPMWVVGRTRPGLPCATLNRAIGTWSSRAMCIERCRTRRGTPAFAVRTWGRLGVERHVLSPMPELLSYWLDAEDGAILSRYLNETLAEMVALAPERFSALGAAPLQNMDRAIRELEFAVVTLGLAGIEVGSNVGGVPIGDPRFWPFFEAAQACGRSDLRAPVAPRRYGSAGGDPPHWSRSSRSLGRSGLPQRRSSPAAC